MIISKYDNLQECRGWGARIPALHFEKEWDVKIIPPFGGAVIRFYINYNGKHVSVYLDGYSELGYMVDENDKPIYEGRFNLGAISLHFPMILAKAKQENKDFYAKTILLC